MRLRTLAALTALAFTTLPMVADLGKTTTFTATTTFVAVRTHITANQVTVFENTTSPTHDFQIAVPTALDTGVTHAAGERFLFVAPKNTTFNSGQIVGYIKVVSDTATFAQEEF